MEYRTERDTLGDVKVPKDAYYGAQTMRAIGNFPVSGAKLPTAFVRAQAVIKLSAAKANMECGALEERLGEAIIKAAEEVREGRFDGEFLLDVFQAGAGTSQNMNANEVIANRANEILGAELGTYEFVHPNDHVNYGQSTNDTIHTAIHIAALSEIEERLMPAMKSLESALSEKARAFDGIVKSGRTHLQDAVPIRLGQIFGAYASMIRLGSERIERSLDSVRELAIGGSAVGTGLNTAQGYRESVVKYISEATGHEFRNPENLIEAMQSFGAVLDVAGALRLLVASLKKIADDLRLISSGPRTGLGEIDLPAVQPGSSIMPGKVNPVMAEMLNMVCSHALGCDAAIVHAAHGGQLELNVMMPVIAYDLLFEIDILTGGMVAFTTRCVEGIEANEDVCRSHAEKSPSLATALNVKIGYHEAAELAKEALERDVSIRELVIEKGILDEETLRDLLDLYKMTENPSDT